MSSKTHIYFLPFLSIKFICEHLILNKYTKQQNKSLINFPLIELNFLDFFFWKKFITIKISITTFIFYPLRVFFFFFLREWEYILDVHKYTPCIIMKTQSGHASSTCYVIFCGRVILGGGGISQKSQINLSTNIYYPEWMTYFFLNIFYFFDESLYTFFSI